MNRFPVENIDKVEESVNADKLSSSKKITLSGDISGSTNFDGSSDVSISVNVATADFATDAEHAASSAVCRFPSARGSYEQRNWPCRCP